MKLRSTARFGLALCIAALVSSSGFASADEKRVVSAAPFIDRQAADCGLQKAIDSLGEKGGVLEIPEGEYPLCRYLFLRSGVTLRGAGMGKTIITVGNPPRFSHIVGSNEDQSVITLENAEGLSPGMLMTIFSYGKNTHRVHRSHPTAKAVQGNMVTLEDHKYRFKLANKPYAIWGVELRLTADAAKGESVIHVDTPALCKPGYGITLSGPGDQWDFHYNVVAAVEGDKLMLERPLTVSPKKGTVVNLCHSAIVSEGQQKIGIENLTIRGFVTDTFAGPWSGFTVGGIHLWKVKDVVIRNVAVENWSGDGFSIQGVENILVSECVATGNYGHGFHPGTDTKVARFERLKSTRNQGDGLYYCWHNHAADVYDSILSGNAGNGIGGLGNPGDNNCTIAGNTIEDNGQSGIHAYGGNICKNVIRNNIIRNNSRSSPGKWPGILLAAIYSESLYEVTVENNVIESTSEPPTQTVGIEERHAKPDKRFEEKADKTYGLFLCDRNRIVGNKLKGHTVADIIVAGPNTIVADNEGRIEKRLPTPVAPPAATPAETKQP